MSAGGDGTAAPTQGATSATARPVGASAASAAAGVAGTSLHAPAAAPAAPVARIRRLARSGAVDGDRPRRALVTGASGALGSAIAERLAADGFELVLHGHRGGAALDALAARLAAAGRPASVHRFDLRDDDACAAACAAMLAEGPVQVVVHNAGVHDDAVLAGMRPAQWHDVVDLSLNGFYRVVQPLLLPMLRTRWGRIVSISSVAAVMGNRGQVNYAAAKAGLHGATRALALEVASRGVTVNVVAPGVIASPMADAAFDAERIAQMVPAGRAGTACEVAALVAFLAGDDAGYITGQVVSINGGMA